MGAPDPDDDGTTTPVWVTGAEDVDADGNRGEPGFVVATNGAAGDVAFVTILTATARLTAILTHAQKAHLIRQLTEGDDA